MMQAATVETARDETPVIDDTNVGIGTFAIFAPLAAITDSANCAMLIDAARQMCGRAGGTLIGIITAIDCPRAHFASVDSKAATVVATSARYLDRGAVDADIGIFASPVEDPLAEDTAIALVATPIETTAPGADAHLVVDADVAVIARPYCGPPTCGTDATPGAASVGATFAALNIGVDTLVPVITDIIDPSAHLAMLGHRPATVEPTGALEASLTAVGAVVRIGAGAGIAPVAVGASLGSCPAIVETASRAPGRVIAAYVRIIAIAPLGPCAIGADAGPPTAIVEATGRLIECAVSAKTLPFDARSATRPIAGPAMVPIGAEINTTVAAPGRLRSVGT